MNENEGSARFYNLLQISFLLIAISVLLFYSVVFGTKASAMEISTALPILSMLIVIISLGISTSKLPLNKYVSAIFLSLIITFMALVFLLLAQEQLYVSSVIPFITSTITYMILGLLAAVGLSFAYLGKTPFITWGKTKLARDVFFVGVAIWFVLGMTAYLNLSAFEVAPFLGVPFNTQTSGIDEPITGATVRGLAGYIEGNFFFTFLLGFITATGLSKIFPEKNVWARLLTVGVFALIFGVTIAYLHTGMHDITQTDVLWFIGLFFFAGALTTLFFGTSFSFTIAQFILDFVNSLFSTLLPHYIQLGWIIILVVSAIAMGGLMFWHPWKK